MAGKHTAPGLVAPNTVTGSKPGAAPPTRGQKARGCARWPGDAHVVDADATPARLAALEGEHAQAPQRVPTLLAAGLEQVLRWAVQQRPTLPPLPERGLRQQTVQGQAQSGLRVALASQLEGSPG